MILVANGCSHTCGAELEFPGQRACYDKAWPKYLANCLNFDCVNLADSGASAHRVVRTTMRYVIDSFLEKKKLDDHFFVILWPGIYRDEIRLFDNATEHEKNLFYDDGWLSLMIGNERFYRKAFSRRMLMYFKSWVAIHEDVKAQMDYLHHILLLQNFFTLHKINYLFWTASHTPITNYSELKGYLGLINKKRYPHIEDINKCYTVLMQSSNQLISKHSITSGFGSHYDEAAQVWFADYLLKYIDANSILP